MWPRKTRDAAAQGQTRPAQDDSNVARGAQQKGPHKDTAQGRARGSRIFPQLIVQGSCFAQGVCDGPSFRNYKRRWREQRKLGGVSYLGPPQESSSNRAFEEIL